MTDAEELNILLGVIGAFGGIIIWGMKGFSMRIISKLNDVDVRQMECTRRFADAEHNAETHSRIFRQIEDLDKRISVIETKLMK